MLVSFKHYKTLDLEVKCCPFVFLIYCSKALIQQLKKKKTCVSFSVIKVKSCKLPRKKNLYTELLFAVKITHL